MKHRLFIASFIQKELSFKINERTEMFRHDAFKPIAIENLHITFAFLGDREETEIPSIRQFLPGINDELTGMSFRLAGVSFFEQHGSKNPVVLFLELSKDINLFIENLKKEMDCDEAKQFIPHITIGKIKKEYSAEAIDRLTVLFRDLQEEYPIPPAVLAKSINTPKRSFYTVI